MSKQQALLETLLGAAQLSGKQTVADQLRNEISKMSQPREFDGYQRLSRAAADEPKCALRKAA